jgi:alpha-tubulin suppressor-like RCC1 family protein
LGDGLNITPTSPIKLTSIPHAKSVEIGNDNSYVLDNDGNVWAWDDNGYGHLGNNTITSPTEPI